MQGYYRGKCFVLFDILLKVTACSLFQALGDAGKFEEADREFNKALELEPDNATALVHRG